MEKMILDLNERFDFAININAPKFEPTYIIATALDRRYKGSLEDDQLERAKSRLLYEVILFVIVCYYLSYST